MSNFMWDHPFLGRLLITVIVLAGIAFGLWALTNWPAQTVVITLGVVIFGYVITLLFELVDGIYEAFIW